MTAMIEENRMWIRWHEGKLPITARAYDFLGADTEMSSFSLLT